MASSIEWLKGGETWNPIRARLKDHVIIRRENGKDKLLKRDKKGWACVRISPGCVNCYSATQNENCGTNPTRAGTGLDYTVPALSQVQIYLDEKTLLAPLHWKKPRLIFPCSMTDWMADFVPDEWRDKMLAVMALTPQHTYLTLTKRADRQRKYFGPSPELDGITRDALVEGEAQKIYHDRTGEDPSMWLAVNWPIKNHWMGVSAEDQEYADKRIPELLQTPAAVRWVSAEPLLEVIDLKHLHFKGMVEIDAAHGTHGVIRPHGGTNARLDWVVVGGESGSGARPFNIEWARQIVAQCQAAGVPVFVKQLGSKPFLHSNKSLHIDKPGLKLSMQSLEIKSSIVLEDRKGGDISEWPEDLRVREYPRVKGAAA